MQAVKDKLREALALIETTERKRAAAPTVERSIEVARDNVTKTPSTEETAKLLTECLAVLEYGTFNNGQYNQLNTVRYHEHAAALVQKLAGALGVKPYETMRNQLRGNNS